MKKLVMAAAILAASLHTLAADAADCSALTKLDGGNPTANPVPTVYYVTGSTAVKPLLATLAPVIFSDTARPATLVYVGKGSCDGVKAILSGEKLKAGTTASYWDPESLVQASSSKTAKEESCTIDADVAADLGVSDVFAQSCGLAQQGLPNGFGDFQGPIQSMTFAVNKASAENVISAEAAYIAMGLGTLAPWNNNDLIFRRNADSGTQQMISAAIGVPATRWVGKNAGGSGDVFNGLANLTTQGDKDKAIGILAADYSSRDELKQLAYQHYGQRCGFKPDVQPLDKKNVRDGHYAIWGPLHLLTQTDPGTRLPQKPEVNDLVSYLTGTQPPPLSTNLIRTEVNLHVVPPCAMKVERKSEMGPMTSFKPAVACGCAFDKEAIGTATCAVCTTNQQCGANQACNFGYCENQ